MVNQAILCKDNIIHFFGHLSQALLRKAYYYIYGPEANTAKITASIILFKVHLQSPSHHCSTFYKF